MKQWQFMGIACIVAMCSLSDSAAIVILVMALILFILNVWLDS